MADKWEWVALPPRRPVRCDDPTTLGRVIGIVKQETISYRGPVGPDTRLADIENADSMSVPSIIVEIEKQFETRIPDEVAETMRTIQDMVDYLGANPKRFLLRPAEPPAEGIVLLRPAAGDDGTLLRASTEAAGGCMDGHGGPSHHGSRP